MITLKPHTLYEIEGNFYYWCPERGAELLYKRDEQTKCLPCGALLEGSKGVDDENPVTVRTDSEVVEVRPENHPAVSP